MFMNYYRSLLESMQPVHLAKVFVDVGVFAGTLAIWMLIDVYMPRNKIGFQCDDNSIGLPYKQSTVKNNVQVLYSIFLPLILITGTEVMRRFYESYKTKKKYVYKLNLCGGKIVNVPDTIGSLYINLGSYFYGLVITSILVNIIKYTYGRLRPHYLDVCQPMLLSSNENIFLKEPDCSFKRFYEYRVDYTCRTINKKLLDEASLSFPSNITALVFYTTCYLVLYLKCTWKFSKFGLLTPFLQVIFISLSTYIGMTRVSDYKHFLSDVFAGATIGILVGSLVFYVLTDFYKQKVDVLATAIEASTSAAAVANNQDSSNQEEP